MKRVVMSGPKTSVVEEVPTVVNGENELLIRLRYMGICMSERYSWSTAAAGTVLGHEPMGVVAAVGSQVRGFAVGERVSGLWAQGMTEYNTVDPTRETVVKIPESVRDEDAVIEPLACILSAASKARIRVPGDPVIVVGCGYMGCGAISVLRMRGAHVIAVDVKEAELKRALQFGAVEVYTPAQALEKFGAATDENGRFSFRGVPTVMEWGGNERSLDTAIQLTAKCGQLCVGGYHTGGNRSVDMQQLNVKAIDCLSVHPREEDLLDTCARNSMTLLADGLWSFHQVPTKIYPMDQLDRAYRDMEQKDGTFMKALLSMEHIGGEPRLV